jgi:hypothetical protein
VTCWLRPRNAHTLTDRATWANFKNRQTSKSWPKATQPCSTPTAASWSTPPSVKAAEVKTWHEWLTSKAGLDSRHCRSIVHNSSSPFGWSKIMSGIAAVVKALGFLDKDFNSFHVLFRFEK